MHPQALTNLARSVQPLIFETGIEDYPYSMWGTTFLVGYKGRVFVLATRHTLKPENIGPICIFATDGSRRLLPLKSVFFAPQADVEDDFADLAVIEVDRHRLQHPELRATTIIDLDKACGDWLSTREAAEFAVIGFPEERSSIDYETGDITTRRVALRATYSQEAAIPFLHELKVDTPHGLDNFSGLSGAPVFSWHEQLAAPASVCLCGMVLQGTATSSILRFLDRSVLLDALELASRTPIATNDA